MRGYTETYKVPPNLANGGANGEYGRHYSTSSSKYSMSVSEFDASEADHQENGRKQSADGSYASSFDSFETSESHHSEGMPGAPSNSTFRTYLTASGSTNPSFSSINNSILRNPSAESIDSVTRDQRRFDQDITPKMPQGSQLSSDNVDDKTPIIGQSERFNQEMNGSNLQLGNGANDHRLSRLSAQNLPQHELSAKFQRLSMTLQSSVMNMSGESQEFMSSFQQNVDRANKQAPTERRGRTSSYYQKIKEPDHSKNDEDVDEHKTDVMESSVVNHDQFSEVSTVSNRSSIQSEVADGFSPSVGERLRPALSSADDDDGYRTVSNKSSFNFENDTPRQSPDKKNLHNIRGSRIFKSSTSPEIPPMSREHLANRLEKLSASDKESASELNKYVAGRDINNEMHAKYPQGLNISYTSSGLDPKSSNNAYQSTDTATIRKEVESTKSVEPERWSAQPTNSEEEEDLSSLFIRALHPFESASLQSESDISICLSFNKNDIAFVHTIDDSGWGEVTLLDSLERGWIPMNYFTMAISENDVGDDTVDEDDEEDDGKISNSDYLKVLFHACGRFLINPLSHKNRRGRFTFSIRVINAIRDGVRVLLQSTDCLSRSNEIVTKRPAVRRARKSLLADWYDLMVKANEFKGTANYNKIEVLTLMVYRVSRKAIDFLQAWSIESSQIVKRENEKKLQNDMNHYPLLSTAPLAKHRLIEINGILYFYLGLIIGRLDLVEHNPAGCDIIETITHQIILLLRELLFISKTGSDFSSQKPSNLDGALDALLSLVSDLVSSVKNLVVRTLSETEEDKNYSLKETSGQKNYQYTQEGATLIQTASKMIKAISVTIHSIRKLLNVTGDFKLNSERAYPDYSRIKIEADEFIKKCSIGIVQGQSIKNRDLRKLGPRQNKNVNRFSVIRSGMTGSLALTKGGVDMLHDALLDLDSSSPFSISNAEFEPFSNTDSTSDISSDISKELLVDANGNLLGASFRGLVYTLTNERSPPEYFFISTFFLCFRDFASGIDLVEELITRFDIANNASADKNDLSLQLNLKNRRKLVVKTFQYWLESYWNHETDYALLTTLINFFNEIICQVLPLEGMRLLEICARLSSRPLVENQKESSPQKNIRQLVNRSIVVNGQQKKNSVSGDIPVRFSMVDSYELSKINTNSSTTSSIKSMAMPLPLGVGNQTSSASSIITRSQMTTIEKVVYTYRTILGENWCASIYIEAKKFIPISISMLLPNWFNICEQSWALSNYRPNLLDFNGLELAKQFTLVESHIFCSIKSSELLNENFTVKKAHLNLAPNVRRSLLFTNCLSGYVLESILQPNISYKKRVNSVKTWLKVAISCLYLRNFNSLAAIITTLQSHLVTRLTKLWADLSDKYKDLYEYLVGIIHPNKNYSVYRDKLKNFLVSNDYNIPIVPYFSLFLSDLTFIVEGNPSFRKANTFLNQKLINIDKYLKMSRVIAQVERLQVPYADPSNASEKDHRESFGLLTPGGKSVNKENLHIIAVPALQELILLELWKVSQLNKAEEDRAWKLSCEIQPRDSN